MANAFVIGPAKSGTTLLISLLDNHPQLSTIPLEIKYYEHYYNTLKHTASYELLNRFFLSESKLRFLDPKNCNQTDLMNSGHIGFSRVDFPKLKEIMDSKAIEYNELSGRHQILAQYIIDLHRAYSQSLGESPKQGFAIKEGNHGLPYLDLIKQDFQNAKFIVMVRDPRDMYSSFKIIHNLNKSEKSYPSFFALNISILNYLFSNTSADLYSKSCTGYMDYFKNIEASDNVLFLRYEDLVGNTRLEMTKVAEFLRINFAETMLAPTTAGNIWGGNASSKKKFDKIIKSRRKKWLSLLTKQEVLLIEYFLADYFVKYGYQRSLNTISKFNCIFSIRPAHFGRPDVNWKDFLRPYFRIARYLVRSGGLVYSIARRMVKTNDTQNV